MKINKVNTNIKMCLHHALCFWLGHTDRYSNQMIRINVLFCWREDGRKSWKQCIIIQFTKRVIHSFRKPLGKAVSDQRWSGIQSAAGAVRCRRAVRDPGWTYGLRCSGDRRAYRQNFCRSCRRVRRNRLPHRGSRRRWGSDRGSRYRCLYLSSMKYYFKPIRELPTGRGFADFVYLPKPEFRRDYPALLVELKWNHSAYTALNQIKEKKYIASLETYMA